MYEQAGACPIDAGGLPHVFQDDHFSLIDSTPALGAVDNRRLVINDISIAGAFTVEITFPSEPGDADENVDH